MIRTWDDGTISDTEDVPISEDAIPLRKSADSEGHSNKASEDTQTTKSTDIGEDGNPYYHQLESTTPEKRQEEQAFRKQLNKSIRNMVSGTNHQGIRLIVHRPEITPEFIEEYNKLSSETMPVVKELVRKTMPLLIHEDSTSISKNHLYGSQFNADSIAKKDFRYYAKKRPPDESPSLVVALRIDESASMSAFGRLEAAKHATVAVYEFCEQCKIPIIIYGDTADSSPLEQMSLYAYCDFVHAEQEDRFRLMNIKGRSNNRDGMAIRILSEKLLMTKEQTKLMISISDGQPKAMPNYSGDVAIRDMQMVLKEYRRKGITFLAAAIGQDKDTICDIYGKESFLDITDLRQLPVRLVKIIARYLSR